MIVKLLSQDVLGDVLYITVILSDPSMAPVTYRIGPFSIAALTPMTGAQRKQAFISQARAQLIPQPVPSLGFNTGDVLDIGS